MECSGAVSTFNLRLPSLKLTTVQIAVAKFFDGEGPDPVAEAQASLNSPPPPRPFRPAHINGSPLSSRSSGPTGDPVSRIVAQPADQGAYPPPLLLTLFFTPFTILYRLFTTSLGLFGTLFPFLPRLMSSFSTSHTGQGTRRNTSGRRPLNPKDNAARFIREFEEEYGSNFLPFAERGYNDALDTAKRDLKFLLVVLLSPEHDDTTSWVRDTLLSPQVNSFINDPQNNMILWAGNVQDSEAYQVANNLRCTKFPFAALVVHTPEVRPSAMSAIARLTGPTTASAFVEKLRTAITQNEEALNRLRAVKAEQQASRNIREEQDSAYERSLAADRRRAQEKREAGAAKARAEKEVREKIAAKEKRAKDVEKWKRWRAHSLPNEPGSGDKEAIRISIRMSSGERVIRKFGPEADIEELYAFVECYDLLKEGTSSSFTEEEPEGFDHKYGFRLVSPMPRTVYEVEEGGSIGDRIGSNGNLLVESMNVDDSDEEEIS